MDIAIMIPTAMSIPSVRDSKKCLTNSSRGMAGSCDCCSVTIIMFLEGTEDIINHAKSWIIESANRNFLEYVESSINELLTYFHLFILPILVLLSYLRTISPPIAYITKIP
jgi:hypothetical protein